MVSKSHDQIQISSSLDTEKGQDSESDDSVNEIVDDEDKDDTDLSRLQATHLPLPTGIIAL